jgi:ubiquinone biosynthesis monooxygenase Coq7
MEHWVDRVVLEVDRGLRSLGNTLVASRSFPESTQVLAPEGGAMAPRLTEAERRHAGGLMRVNHVGEVCAQALYRAQALATDSPALRTLFEAAAVEEADHLAWTAQRLEELGARPSLLNPLWFAGAYALGLAAGRAGDAVSLGFVVETERQVEQHLEGHLETLPPADTRSRVLVEQMRDDEARHGAAARDSGAQHLPAPLRLAMRAAAKLMTTTAYRI